MQIRETSRPIVYKTKQNMSAYAGDIHEMASDDITQALKVKEDVPRLGMLSYILKSN